MSSEVDWEQKIIEALQFICAVLNKVPGKEIPFFIKVPEACTLKFAVSIVEE